MSDGENAWRECASVLASSVIVFTTFSFLSSACPVVCRVCVYCLCSSCSWQPFSFLYDNRLCCCGEQSHECQVPSAGRRSWTPFGSPAMAQRVWEGHIFATWLHLPRRPGLWWLRHSSRHQHSELWVCRSVCWTRSGHCRDNGRSQNSRIGVEKECMHNAVLLTGILVSHDFVVFREVWVRTSANPLCFGGKKVCMGKQQQTITHTHTLSLSFSLSLSLSLPHTHTHPSHTHRHTHTDTHTN